VLLKPSEKKLYFCDYIFRLDRWRLKGTHTHTHTYTHFSSHTKKYYWVFQLTAGLLLLVTKSHTSSRDAKKRKPYKLGDAHTKSVQSIQTDDRTWLIHLSKSDYSELSKKKQY
jgi:hypothetical protein